MSNITSDDLIFYSDSENNIYSGGFSVNSIMMKNGISPILTLNNQIQKGGNEDSDNVSDIFKDLVVPNWLVFQNQSVHGGAHNHSDYESSDDEEDHVIQEDIHTKLLDLVKADSNKKRHNKTKNLKKSNILKRKKSVRRNPNNNTNTK